jgi:hypothetical protein
VDRRDHQVLAVLVRAGVVAQLEQVADREATGARRGVGALVLRLQLLHPGAHVGLPVRPGAVLARVVVDLHPGAHAGLTLRPGEVLPGVVVDLAGRGLGLGRGPPADQEPRLRPREVEVAEGVDLGLDLVGDAPLADALGLAGVRLGRPLEGHRLVTREAGVGAVVVGEHQGVAPAVLGEVVPEVVVDPLLLHQPADEREVGLPVLDAVLPAPVLAVERLLEVGEAVLAKDRLKDLGHGQVLKDPAVRAPRQEPEPGPQDQAIASVAPGGRHPQVLEAADVAVEVPPAPPGQLQAHGHRLAEDLGRAHVVALAQAVRRELEEPPELLAGGHPVEEEGVGERADEVDGQVLGHGRTSATAARPGTRRPAHGPKYGAARPGPLPRTVDLRPP